MIPAFSRLNPDRDKIFNFYGRPSSNPKFGPANSAHQLFRFGAQDYLTPDLNFLKNCFGDKFSTLNSPISTTLDHRGAHNITANSFSLRHIQTNTWTAHLDFGIRWSNSHLSHDQLRQTTFADFGELQLLEKIFAFLHIPHVTPLGFSQQFEAQHSLPKQVYYVAGCWRSLSSSMWRPISARTTRSDLQWRFAYVLQNF